MSHERHNNNVFDSLVGEWFRIWRPAAKVEAAYAVLREYYEDISLPDENVKSKNLQAEEPIAAEHVVAELAGKGPPGREAALEKSDDSVSVGAARDPHVGSDGDGFRMPDLDDLIEEIKATSKRGCWSRLWNYFFGCERFGNRFSKQVNSKLGGYLTKITDPNQEIAAPVQAYEYLEDLLKIDTETTENTEEIEELLNVLLLYQTATIADLLKSEDPETLREEAKVLLDRADNIRTRMDKAYDENEASANAAITAMFYGGAPKESSVVGLSRRLQSDDVRVASISRVAHGITLVGVIVLISYSLTRAKHSLLNHADSKGTPINWPFSAPTWSPTAASTWSPTAISTGTPISAPTPAPTPADVYEKFTQALELAELALFALPNWLISQIINAVQGWYEHKLNSVNEVAVLLTRTRKLIRDMKVINKKHPKNFLQVAAEGGEEEVVACAAVKKGVSTSVSSSQSKYGAVDSASDAAMDDDDWWDDFGGFLASSPRTVRQQAAASKEEDWDNFGGFFGSLPPALRQRSAASRGISAQTTDSAHDPKQRTSSQQAQRVMRGARRHDRRFDASTYQEASSEQQTLAETAESSTNQEQEDGAAGDPSGFRGVTLVSPTKLVVNLKAPIIKTGVKLFDVKKFRPLQADGKLDAGKLRNVLGKWDIQEATRRSLQDAEQLQKSVAALQARAASFGYRCKNVLGDGRCFYYAFAVQVSQLMRERYENLDVAGCLGKLTQHMIENQQLYEDFILQQYRMDLNTFFDKLLTNTGELWGDHVLILAASRAFNVDVAIVPSDRNQPIIFRRSQPEGRVYLGYEVGRHYQALVRDERIEQPAENLDLYIDSTVADEWVENASPPLFQSRVSNP